MRLYKTRHHILRIQDALAEYGAPPHAQRQASYVRWSRHVAQRGEQESRQGAQQQPPTARTDDDPMGEPGKSEAVSDPPEQQPKEEEEDPTAKLVEKARVIGAGGEDSVEAFENLMRDPTAIEQAVNDPAIDVDNDMVSPHVIRNTARNYCEDEEGQEEGQYEPDLPFDRRIAVAAQAYEHGQALLEKAQDEVHYVIERLTRELTALNTRYDLGSDRAPLEQAQEGVSQSVKQPTNVRR